MDREKQGEQIAFDCNISYIDKNHVTRSIRMKAEK